MKDEQRKARQRQIETAAYELLEAEGYQAISMLKIAKRAKASNETLYRWYGDKKGLFAALVENNARDIRSTLRSHLEGADDPWLFLNHLGPGLLRLLTGKRAIALNRAATGDATGALGRALAEQGREAVMPLMAQCFEGICRVAALPQEQARGLAELYLSVLVGDLQVRRVTGAIPAPDETEIAARAERAEKFIRTWVEGPAQWD